MTNKQAKPTDVFAASAQSGSAVGEPPKNKKSSWRLSVFWVLALALFLFWFAEFIQNRAPNALVIQKDRLSDPQYRQLAQKLAPFEGDGFYDVDIKSVAQALADLSWTQSVQVRRDWRRGVVVEVAPKVAVANFGSDALLDARGSVFAPAHPGELGDANLASVYSAKSQTAEVMQKVYKLNRWFAPLELVVEDIVLTPRQTWFVRFNSGLRVVVDHEYVDEKLFDFSRLLIEDRLGVPLDEIDAVDLRYKNGFSLTKKLKAQS